MSAWTWLASLREQAGDHDGAETAARAEAAAGNTYEYEWGGMRLARLREQAGDHDGASLIRRFGITVEGLPAQPPAG